MSSTLVAAAGNSGPRPVETGRLPGAPVWFSLALWLAGIIVILELGYLAPSGGVPVALLVSIFGPQIAFWLCYACIGRFRRFILGIDLPFLISVQSWRVVGAALLFLWAYGMVSGGFALPAALGDIVVGVAAVFVALRVARRSAGWRRHAVILSLIGLADFLLAIGAAYFAGPTPFDPPPLDAAAGAGLLTRLPLGVIPAFLVPAFSCAHFAALAQLLRPGDR